MMGQGSHSGKTRSWRLHGAVFYPSHCSLQTLGVDSAEADKVGSHAFRFCAYAGRALDEGVLHCRTAPVHNSFIC
jgi:hypothetical protein